MSTSLRKCLPGGVLLLVFSAALCGGGASNETVPNSGGDNRVRLLIPLSPKLTVKGKDDNSWIIVRNPSVSKDEQGKEIKIIGKDSVIAASCQGLVNLVEKSVPGDSNRVFLLRSPEDRRVVADIFLPKDAAVFCRDEKGADTQQIEIALSDKAGAGRIVVVEKGSSDYALAPAEREFRIAMKGGANGFFADWELPHSSTNQVESHILLRDKRAAARDIVDYNLQKDVLPTDTSQARLAVVFFRGASSDGPWTEINAAPVELGPRGDQNGVWGTVRVPDPGAPGGAHRAVLLVTRADGESFRARVDDITITRPWLGIILAGGILVLLYVVILVLAKPATAWSGLNLMQKFVRLPVAYAVTPLRHYSISLAQVTWWTVLVAFSYLYVAFTRAEFLSPTDQILLLLGISAGTAALAKTITVTKIQGDPASVAPYVDELGVARDNVPKFRDLISIGDNPNIFKFQVLVFNLFVGAQVLVEVCRSGRFPQIEQNLWQLLGVSSGAYLVHELTLDSPTREAAELASQLEDVRKKITAETDAAKKAALQTQEADLKKKLKDKLEALL